MITRLNKSELSNYVTAQLAHFFPDGNNDSISPCLDHALDRVEFSFSKTKLAGYQQDGQPLFNHLHSDQYAAFIYILSNECWRRGALGLAEKLYCLNKLLNGFMCMYDTILPDVFALAHTVGMMLGKAIYSDYFFASHHCTVGTNRGAAPTIGRAVILYGGASIIGNCNVGDFVSVSAQAMLLDTSVPADHVVIGSGATAVFKPAKRRLAREIFDIP